MKIHFASLFGVDYEQDFMHYWLRFYLDRSFNSYMIFLHREKGEVDPALVAEFRNHGFKVKTCGGPQGNGKLRKLLLEDYAKTLPPEDFLVTADADEIQCVPSVCVPDTMMYGKDSYVIGQDEPDPIDYQVALSHYDILSGFMVDRFSFELEESSLHENPFVQYPFEEPYTRDILKSFTPFFLKKTSWPFTRRTKILAARAGSDCGYEGSHCMYSTAQTARVHEEYRVMHFAWRESARYKAVVKSYFSEANLNEIFGGEAPKECVEYLQQSQGEQI